MDAGAVSVPATPRAVSREARLRLAACAGAAALLQIDGTIVTVALPSVGDSLSAGSHSVSLVLTTYFLAYGLMLFPGGSLVDRIGSRQVAFAGLSLFAIGAMMGMKRPSSMVRPVAMSQWTA